MAVGGALEELENRVKRLSGSELAALTIRSHEPLPIFVFEGLQQRAQEFLERLAIINRATVLNSTKALSPGHQV